MYDFTCQQALQPFVIDLIEQATQTGWDPRSTLRALAEIVGSEAVAYEHDPDPADDAGDTESGRNDSADTLVARFISGRDVSEG